MRHENSSIDLRNCSSHALHVASVNAPHLHYWSRPPRLVAILVNSSLFAEICTWPKTVRTSVELLVTKAAVCCPLQLGRRHLPAAARCCASCADLLFGVVLCRPSRVCPRAFCRVRARCTFDWRCQAADFFGMR